MNETVATTRASKTFNNASRARSRAKSTYPVPIRFTKDELALLKAQAGDQFLSVYIRDQLLGNQQEKRRRLRKPRIDDKKAAAILAALGKSRLPSNLNQLAKQANLGILDISDETDVKLQEASDAVIAMRDALFIALGLRTKFSDDT